MPHGFSFFLLILCHTELFLIIYKNCGLSDYPHIYVEFVPMRSPDDYCMLQCRTHWGATFTGIAYGYLTSPVLQMKNASSKNGEDGIAVVRRGPCRSLLFFSFFILVLCSLLLVVEPPPSSVALL